MHMCRTLCRLQAAAVDTSVDDQAAGSQAAAAAAGISQRRILQGLSAQRVQRLETLVELKKLYRNIIRAEALLALPSPVYTAPEGEAGAGGTHVLQQSSCALVH